MKITSKAGNGNKVHIYIDEKYAFTLYDDYWYGLKYKEGDEIGDDELASLKEEAGFRCAYEKGLKHLGTRMYSKKEITDKLKLKFGADGVERAVEKLEYYGYINDEAFCEEYARYLLEVKKFDIRRIQIELRRKGIDAQTASNTLKTLDNEPISRIIEMLRTKYERYLHDEKDIKQLTARLVRMGYGFSDIREALRSVSVELGESDY